MRKTFNDALRAAYLAGWDDSRNLPDDSELSADETFDYWRENLPGLPKPETAWDIALAIPEQTRPASLRAQPEPF